MASSQDDGEEFKYDDNLSQKSSKSGKSSARSSKSIKNSGLGSCMNDVDAGSAWTWGADYSSVLGLPNNLKKQVKETKLAILPKKMDELMKNVARVQSRGLFTFAVKNNGAVYSWGSNTKG